jgi:cytochrome b involved in lipid metabolism
LVGTAGRRKPTLAPILSMTQWRNAIATSDDISTTGNGKKRHSLNQKAAIDTALSVVVDECILDIHGQRYNLTTWATAHPGGVGILRKFHQKDATKSFTAVGHSATAHAKLQDFLISNDGKNTLMTAGQHTADARIDTSTTTRWRQKLFTKEDPIGVHKYLGIFCLAHFAVRFFQLFVGDPAAGFGTRLGRGPHIGPALCLVPHALLSLSSLIFHTGKRVASFVVFGKL